MEILLTTLPIFLLIGLGYLITWRGVLTPDQVGGMGNFTINVALPALIFRLLSHYRLQDVLEWRYFLVYGVGSLAVMLAAFAYWRRVEGCGAPAAAVRGFGMSVANSGFIGLPIAMQALGPQAGVALALTLTVENLLMLPALIILAEQGEAQGAGAALRQIARALATSPLVIAIAAAVIAILAGVQPAAPIGRALDLLGDASAPVALVVIGGSLVHLDTKGMGGAVWRITLGKLLLHPLAVAAMLLLVPIANPILRHAAVLLAAVPMASSYPIFGQRYGEAPLAAAALLACTTAAFVTLNLVLWLIRSGVLR